MATDCSAAAVSDLEKFLFNYGLSNCLKYLKNIKVTNIDSLRKLPNNDLKAIFKPEVRNKLQRALKGQEPEIGPNDSQEQYVALDEEEEANDESGKKKASKKKKGPKASTSKQPSSTTTVPGQEGVTLDPEFASVLATLGLSSYSEMFERNNMTSFISCRLITRDFLINTFGIPQEKAGKLLATIITHVPLALDRRLPELAFDLTAAVASMHVTEAVRDEVKTALQSNSVLSVADAMAKRYSLMNDVGLSADAATELGRLLDAGPSVWQHQPESFLPPAARHSALASAALDAQRTPTATGPAGWPLPAAARAPPPAQYSTWGHPGSGMAVGHVYGDYRPQELLSGRAL